MTYAMCSSPDSRRHRLIPVRPPPEDSPVELSLWLFPPDTLLLMFVMKRMEKIHPGLYSAEVSPGSV